MVFAYGIDGEKRGLEGFPQRAILNPEGQDFNILPEKQVPDAILNPRYSSPPYEYIEGGDE
jgi:hypothetical protein